MVSVIVATKNKSREIIPCIESLLRAADGQTELLIVDQNADAHTRQLLSRFHDRRLRHIHWPRGGKSSALNEGIRRARGTIIAFTDDDCIVSKNWLSRVSGSLQDTGYAAVFGKTLPYQPARHKGKHCPCTMTNTRRRVFRAPAFHDRQIGYGNNMAFRRLTLMRLGGFKRWLGPGSIGAAAEDAEITNRALIRGNAILYEPRAVVYHNKWLSHEQEQNQELLYIRGELSCYTYFRAQGHGFAGPVLSRNMREIFTNSLLQGAERIFGLCIGACYSFLDNLTVFRNVVRNLSSENRLARRLRVRP